MIMRRWLFPPEKPWTALGPASTDRLLIWIALLLVVAIYMHVTWYI